MKVALHLVLAELRLHWIRACLTVLGVGAATAAVVWTYGSYATKQAQAPAHAATLLGVNTHWLTCSNPHRGMREPDTTPPAAAVPAALRDGIARDPRVIRCEAVYQTRTQVLSRDAKRSMKRSGPPLRALVVATGSAESFVPPGEIVGRWLDPADTAPPQAVLVESVARTLDIDVGDPVYLAGPSGETELQVVGLLPCPLSRWDMPAEFPTVYISPASMRSTMGRAGYDAFPLNAMYLRIGDAQDAAAFLAEWRPQAEKAGVWLCDEESLRAQLQRAGSGFDTSGLYIVGLAFLGSLFVIFTTLNIGFGERVRQLALLRAIGMSRGGVARIVLLEGLMAGVVGFLLSLPLGWLILRVTVLLKPALFPSGVAIDRYAVLLAAVASVLGSLLAALLPAWFGLRLQPLDAVARPVGALPERSWSRMSLAGLSLIALSQVLFFAFDLSPATRAWVSGMLGLSILTICGVFVLAVGFILLIPAVLRLVETTLGRIVTRVCHTPPALASQDLTRNVWRSAGVVLSISVGLGLYIAMKTWGYTMLKPYQPTEAVPDLIVSFKPDGLPPKEAARVAAVEGIRADRCLPLVIRQPHLGKAAVERMNALWGETPTGGRIGGAPNVLLVGLDVEMGLAGPEPVLDFPIRDGRFAEAMAAMRRGGHCLIPLSLANLIGVREGDTLPLSLLRPGARGGHPGGGRRPASAASDARPGAASARAAHSAGGREPTPAQEMTLTVAGVYTEPWHLVTGWTGMRGLDGGSFMCNGLVLVNEEDARRVPGTDRTVFFWASRSREHAGLTPEESSVRIRRQLEAIAAAQPPHEYTPFGATAPVAVAMPQVGVVSQEFLIENCLSHATDIFKRMEQLPIFALLISSLAVANTIMASVRSRRWELGVLRSLGLTRTRLLRLLLVEALLIALAATVISLAFGIIAGHSITGIAAVSNFTRGMPIELVVPWPHLAAGVALSFAIVLAATAWPAFSTARREPLGLLQEGRSAM